jgi:hypothetical protein
MWFKRNAFLEHKEIKLQNKRHFIKNKNIDYAACLKNAVNFLVA